MGWKALMTRKRGPGLWLVLSGLLVFCSSPSAVGAAGEDALTGARPDTAEQGRSAAEAEYLPDQCQPEPLEGDAWIDHAQARLYRATCGAAGWFDGFFGDPRFDGATGQTYGRLGLVGAWDQRDGWDHRTRFRARLALPAMENRLGLILGRGDERELVEERRGPVYDALPGSFRGLEDDSFIVGLGYSRGGVRRGFRLSAGARLDLPLNSYVKASYRRAWTLGERQMLRFRPVAYWRREEGAGASLGMDIDHLVSDRMLLRFGNWANVSQSPEVQGVEWLTSLALFQGLNNRRALTYRALVRGQTEAEVAVQDYGLELRYRQRVKRKWLFLELGTSLTWPRSVLAERRESNWGVSLGVEAYFGPVPDWQLY